MKVENLLRDIENRDLVLPEFQREFVWNEDDVKKFIQSLYKNYPTGSLLIWKTVKPPKLRGDFKSSDIGYTRVLLDGQQRLTTLFLFLKGKTPPYYTSTVKDFNLYFNVETREFRYYQKQTMEGKPEWVSLLNFFQHNSAATFISSSKSRDYYFRYLDSLTKLENITKYEYFVDEDKLGSLTDLREVVGIFNLVNRQGRTLTEQDLALAHTCAFWPEIKDLFRRELKLYSERGFLFDFNFLILCLNAAATGHAKFEAFYNVEESKIKDSWEKVKGALEYLINILHDKCYIDSSDKVELKSDALLVPLVVHLANTGGEFTNETEMNKFLYWFFNAMIWGRFSRRGKLSPLEQDVVSITKEKKPDVLIGNLQKEIRYLDVRPENLEGAPISSPFFNMMFIVAKSKGAVDWFNGNSLHSQLFGRRYQLHKHHIFPKELLRKAGYYDDIGKRKLVNEIANRVFLTERCNQSIRSKKPSSYLPAVLNKFPKALKQQFVPEREELWETENFESFLKSRRRIIAREINAFLESLQPEIPKLDLRKLILEDEGYNLEFKETYMWNLTEKRIDKELKFAVIKTIASFLNSNGGTLLIGVSDDHQIAGLSYDYEESWKGNRDGFLMDLSQTIENYIGVNNYKRCIAITFETIDGKDICIVKVEKCDDPIYIKREGGKKFLYIRLENRTEPLEDPEEIQKYIEENWIKE